MKTIYLFLFLGAWPCLAQEYNAAQIAAITASIKSAKTSK